MIDMNFILAGRAVFTVNNDKGEHFTFKVNKHKTVDGLYFAQVLSGGSDSYSYMGLFNKDTLVIHKGNKGMSPEAKSVQVLTWAMRVVDGKTYLPNGYNIQHEGKCGRCSRPLTDPESIRYGLGKVCREK